jgi:hypothetical protein
VDWKSSGGSPPWKFPALGSRFCWNRLALHHDSEADSGTFGWLTAVLALMKARGATDCVDILFLRNRLRFHRLALHHDLLQRDWAGLKSIAEYLNIQRYWLQRQVVSAAVLGLF